MDAYSPVALPRPPIVARQRSQLEAFLVLRRNTLELWGEAAYEEEVLPGKFFGRDQVLLNDPDAIRHVLVDNQGNYERNVATHRVLQPLLGSGLFLAEGDAWRHQRRSIAPAMAPRSMLILTRHIVAASIRAEQDLARAYGAVQLLPVLQRLALSIAARSMFSLEADGFAREMRAKLMQYGLTLAQPGILDLVLPRGMSSPLDRRRGDFRREWLGLMDRIIAERRAKPATAEARDLFDLLCAARDPQTGRGFTHAQLRDEVSTMIIAGHETTAVTLFWACYAAARVPGVQDRIAAEVAGLDLSADGASGAMKQLVFTRAFVDEVLRLYPPAFLIVRVARGGDKIAGRAIARGTVVSISPWVLHRHRRRWTCPETFDAQRFLADAAPPPRYAYLPFGAGPRICVGAQFALTEAVLVVARMVQTFRLGLVGASEVAPRGFVTTQPDRPVHFVVSRRQTN